MDVSNILSIRDMDAQSSSPLYLQIAELIATKIHNSEFPSNTKLPPERELSRIFGVSRTTAINVYRHLEKLGLVSTRVGSGTYVTPSHSAPQHADRSIPWSQLFVPYLQTPLASILKELVSTPALTDNISLAAGMPCPTLYPIDHFNQLVATHLTSTPSADFGHIPTEGYSPLRSSIANMLSNKGISATAASTMILSGSQQSLYLICKTFLDPGDYVIVEAPSYIGAIQSFQSSGARLLTIPVSDRLDLDLIEDYLIRYRPKLFYIMPNFQNPSGRVLSLQERQDLLELAARHRLVIVEDDAYGDLHFDKQPPPPLKALDTYGGVLYLGSFSKILFPGLRIGWLVGPQEVIHRLALEKQYIDLHSNNWTQWLMHKFLEENLLSNHLSIVRTEYKKRRDIAIQALNRYCGDNLEFSIPEGGFYFWCTLKSDCAPRTLLHEAAKQGVSFVPGEAFYPSSAATSQIRLCFTSNNSEQLVEGIRRLGRALHKTTKGVSFKNSPAASSLPII